MVGGGGQTPAEVQGRKRNCTAGGGPGCWGSCGSHLLLQLGVALSLCVGGCAAAVTWHTTSAVEPAGLALAVLACLFCLSCAGNSVRPREEPGENSNKQKMLLAKPQTPNYVSV